MRTWKFAAAFVQKKRMKNKQRRKREGERGREEEKGIGSLFLRRKFESALGNRRVGGGRRKVGVGKICMLRVSSEIDNEKK